MRDPSSSDSSQPWRKRVKPKDDTEFAHLPEKVAPMPPTDPVDQQPSNTQRTVLLATDNQNSVLAEVVGNATHCLTYSAYGHQSARQEVATRLGFNGELREAQTCWYLLGNGYRAYNPRLMRCHSADSWSPFGRGGLNPYMYCVGDPVNRSDPTGHWPPFKAVGSFLKTLGPGKSRPVDMNKLDLSGALQMIGQAENARITYVAPPARSSGIGDILYALGTAHPMPRDSTRVTSVTETARHHRGYAAGAIADGLTHTPSRSTPQALSPINAGSSAINSGGAHGKAMSAWNADTFAASQQGRTYTAYPVEARNPPAHQGVVQSWVLPSSSAQIGSSTHRADRPIAVVAATVRREPTSPPRSQSTSRDSTPPATPQPRNPSGGNNAPNFDDVALGLRFRRR